MGMNKRESNVNARRAGASKMAMPCRLRNAVLQKTARFVGLQVMERGKEGSESVEVLRDLRSVYRVR